MTKRIAIYGGSFDPPHFGHVLTVNHILNAQVVDEVWIVPAGDDRYDKVVHASGVHREKMVRLMVEKFFVQDPVQLNTIALEGNVPGSKTVDLIDTVREKHPNTELFFVIGADNVNKVLEWDSGERLIKEVQFLVVPRLGEKVQDPSPKYVVLVGDEKDIANNCSSQAIRMMIKAGKRLFGIVPVDVANYIEENSLYQL